jgi:diadenosine tetraphosphate (Ap4A) HIT family hydrolase
MRSALQPERTYMCSFVESVPQHLHFHLLPRYSSMPKLGPVGLGRVFDGEWQVSLSEAERAAAAIKAALAEASS